MRATPTVVALVAASAVTFAGIRIADACGCTSPPIPQPDKAGEYAVNQRAEQIIFEVEPNFVTAHVLIKYTGAPESFAWIVPVPEAPELGISPASVFGMLDQLTAPEVSVDVQDLCPITAWACRFHPSPDCGGGGCGMSAAGQAGEDDFASVQDAASAGDAGGAQPPVEIIDEEVVGDYQTVTFRASEAAAAAQWLNDNGFIVNDTTTLYMESYVEANMVFVAVKLLPGAGVSSIKPLRMRFRAPFPMIPLVLTAVAAEPHLTVTSFIYSTTPFRPMSHPVVTIDPARIARDDDGRLNYPMVLSRTIDEAGGDGFAIEYRGGSPRPEFGGVTGCCGNGEFDVCNVGGNTLCECPRDAFDQADCADRGDLLEGVAMVDSLSQRHPYLTRITTRISPEEMRFDPTFEPDAGQPLFGRLQLRGEQPSLAACGDQVLDQTRFATAAALQACAAVYCGEGQCVVTASGAAACACDAGQVARQFVDLDGLPSVTCIPATPPVDLAAGGLLLPDACQGVSCGEGACHDRNGVAVCECDNGAAAAVVADAGSPRCEAIEDLSTTPGGQDYSEPLRELQVCAPSPPSCGAGGWLEHVGSVRPGVDCGNATPSAEQREVPPEPQCDGEGIYGCGCQGGPPAGALAMAWIVGFLLLRKRKHAA